MSPTPGPWRWSKDKDYYPSTDLLGPETCVLQIYESHSGGDMPSEADARLIAAAPDLLAALLLVRGLVNQAIGENQPWEPGCVYAVPQRVAVDIRLEDDRIIRAAIAK